MLPSVEVRCCWPLVDDFVADDPARLENRVRVIGTWLTTTLALIVATRGPLYRIRTDFPGKRTGLLDDNWIQSVSYLAYGLVVLSTLAAWPRIIAGARRLTVGHLGFAVVLSPVRLGRSTRGGRSNNH